jgi:hypothetical protein
VRCCEVALLPPVAPDLATAHVAALQILPYCPCVEPPGWVRLGRPQNV